MPGREFVPGAQGEARMMARVRGEKERGMGVFRAGPGL